MIEKKKRKLTKVIQHKGKPLTLYLYGGYATWRDREGRYRCKEVRVWGPVTWDPAYYDDEGLFVALTRKAQKRWSAAEVREAWRY